MYESYRSSLKRSLDLPLESSLNSLRNSLNMLGSYLNMLGGSLKVAE